MQSYRVYFLDAQGRFRSAQEFWAPHDEDALVRATTLAAGESAELWNQARFITRVEPSKRSAAC